MPEIRSKASRLQLVGGTLCLDFANTAGNHADDHPAEHLLSYADLVAWSQHAGILNEREARRLLRTAADKSAEARRVHARAIVLREAMYRIFSALSSKSKPKRADIELLNRSLFNALANVRLLAADDGFAWDWIREEGALDQMLPPIARSAGELLTSDDLNRVRECCSDTCGWLFVDRSKNHSRRWCAMNDCGNRAKARRHYKRIRSS